MTFYDLIKKNEKKIFAQGAAAMKMRFRSEVCEYPAENFYLLKQCQDREY
jgi:hypothetical protein